MRCACLASTFLASAALGLGAFSGLARASIQDQRKLVLGAWECEFRKGGEYLKGQEIDSVFRDDGTFMLRIRKPKSEQLAIVPWQINHEGLLILSKPLLMEDVNLMTGSIRKSSGDESPQMLKIGELEKSKFVFGDGEDGFDCVRFLPK